MERQIPQDIYSYNLLERLSIPEIVRLSQSNKFYQKLIQNESFWNLYVQRRIENREVSLLIQEIGALDNPFFYNFLPNDLRRNYNLPRLVSLRKFRTLEYILSRLTEPDYMHQNFLLILQFITGNYSREEFEVIKRLLLPHTGSLSKEQLSYIMCYLVANKNVRAILFLNDLGVNWRYEDFKYFFERMTPELCKVDQGQLRELYGRFITINRNRPGWKIPNWLERLFTKNPHLRP